MSMTEQDRSSGVIPFLLAFTVIGGVGSSLYLHEPFESSRPKEATNDILPAADTEFVPARVWQDPFTAISLCKREQTTNGDKNCNSNNTYPTWPRSISSEDIKKLNIMPIMVYGGAYSEDVENRRRRRYAVLSAMAMQDYRLNDADNIGYFEYPSNPTNKESGLVVPYEWLQHNTTHYSDLKQSTKSHTPILLLWLDERQFEQEPLTEIAKLLLEVEFKVTNYKSDLTTTVTLIGPAGSGLLSTMVNEAFDLATAANRVPETSFGQCDNNKDEIVKNFKNWNFSIFSPNATASAKLILGKTEKRIRNHLNLEENQKCKDITGCWNLYYGNNEFTSIFLIEKIFSEIEIQFFRTTQSDQALAKMLVNKEFKNREIDVSSDDHIVILISEWDTFYGRALPEVFKRKITEEVLEQKINEAEEDQKLKINEPEKKALKQKIKNGIRSYYYMRGLDGEVIPVNGNVKTSEASLSKDGKIDERSARSLERAVGVNRFDYLRRLSQKIKDDLSDVSGEIRVIGVLGSDVYDKLLVLQALRPSLPKAQFFTTDADIRYVHPAEFKWARNLIVLSGYGLKLKEAELSEHFHSVKFDSDFRLSSFRDSYQTGMFLAARLAVSRLSRLQPKGEGPENIIADDIYRKELANYLSISKVFEVGRSKFVPLGEPPWSLYEWWDNSKNKWWGPLFVLLCVLLVYLLMVLFDTRRIGPAIFGITLTGVLPIIITYEIYRSDGISGEPLPLLSGANSLPTIAILFLTSICAIYLMRKVYLELKKNRGELTKDFKFNEEIGKSLPTHGYWEIWWGRDFTLELLSPQNELVTDRVWALYQRAADSVVLRATYLAFFHTVFAIAFVLILDDPRPPIRGDDTLLAYRVSACFALLFFFWFLYIVVDQMRLCRALARLSGKTKLIWSNLTLNKFARERGIDLGNSAMASTDSPEWMKDSLMGWLSIQLLAERSQAIDKSVYYPFIILLVLIVARSTLFDSWQFLPSIIIIIVTSILLIVAWAILLRRSVNEARENTLESMQNSLSKGLRSTDHHVEVEQLQLLIDEVKNERRGAFRSFASDPILKAVLMPSGGFGGLFLLEYLAR